MNPLGEHLRARREELGLSQPELERRSGVRQQAISLYEKGRRIPSLVTLGLLGGALDMPVDELDALRQRSIKTKQAPSKKTIKNETDDEQQMAYLRRAMEELSRQMSELQAGIAELEIRRRRRR